MKLSIGIVLFLGIIFAVVFAAGCGYKTAPTPIYDVPQKSSVDAEKERRER